MILLLVTLVESVAPEDGKPGILLEARIDEGTTAQDEDAAARVLNGARVSTSSTQTARGIEILARHAVTKGRKVVSGDVSDGTAGAPRRSFDEWASGFPTLRPIGRRYR